MIIVYTEYTPRASVQQPFLTGCRAAARGELAGVIVIIDCTL
jgi:hypothetical protein